MKLQKIKIVTDGGPWASHDYPCPVFRDRPAVLNLSKGIFEPSWEAQDKGYHLVKVDTYLKKLLYELFFKD